MIHTRISHSGLGTSCNSLKSSIHVRAPAAIHWKSERIFEDACDGLINFVYEIPGRPNRAGAGCIVEPLPPYPPLPPGGFSGVGQQTVRPPLLHPTLSCRDASVSINARNVG
jgi:hypothetical protein